MANITVLTDAKAIDLVMIAAERTASISGYPTATAKINWRAKSTTLPYGAKPNAQLEKERSRPIR